MEMSLLYNRHHLPLYAVDDKVAKNSGRAVCSATEAESGPGMLIDLETIFDISFTTLVKRLDEHGILFHNVSSLEMGFLGRWQLRRLDKQINIEATSFVNVGPTKLPTKCRRWPNECTCLC